MSEALDLWIAEKAIALADRVGVAQLADELANRWSQSLDDQQPPSLTLQKWTQVTDRSWSDFLEIVIALAANQFRQAAPSAERSSANSFLESVVEAFKVAWAERGDSIDPKMGTLWVFDILALRFVPAELGASTCGAASELLVDMCEKVAALNPASDARTYNELFLIYEAISNAMVVEVFDETRTDKLKRFGRSQTPKTAFTIFQESVWADYENTAATGAAKTTKHADQKWLAEFNSQRKCCASALFDKLIELNPDFGATVDSGKFVGPGRNSGPEEAEKYGFQRRLDVPWFRMAHSMLSDVHPQSAKVREYLNWLHTTALPVHASKAGATEIIDDNLGDVPLPIPRSSLANAPAVTTATIVWSGGRLLPHKDIIKLAENQAAQIAENA